MGFFSDLGNQINKKLNDMQQESNKAQEIAKNMDDYYICKKIQQSMSMGQRNGYMKELKNRIEDMNDYELKNIFKDCCQSRLAYACNLIAQELSERGYMEKVDGKWKKVGQW